MELARGWKFACPCTKCTEEMEETDSAISFKDDSKLEASLKRFEDNPAHGLPVSADILNENID
jgi:mitochondrial import receptor subunit TOM20